MSNYVFYSAIFNAQYNYIYINVWFVLLVWRLMRMGSAHSIQITSVTQPLFNEWLHHTRCDLAWGTAVSRKDGFLWDSLTSYWEATGKTSEEILWLKSTFRCSEDKRRCFTMFINTKIPREFCSPCFRDFLFLPQNLNYQREL